MSHDIDDRHYDVLIVGAGPAGLAAGIEAHKRGLEYRILEKGSLVDSIFRFPRNMVFFTTPELLEIGGLPFTTPFEKPTRAEALRYYRRVADAYGLNVDTGEKVTGVTRCDVGKGAPGFRLTTQRACGTGRILSARAVVVATGYYDNPNLLGVHGEGLAHVSHYYTEAHPFHRRDVVVVGGANSAAEAALDLYRSGARVTLVHRRSRLGDSIKYWIRPDVENRIKEGAISARFNTCLVEIRPGSVLLARDGEQAELPADGVFLLTGFHPDVAFLRGSGVRVNEETCVPEHHPETLETNVPGLYLAGAVVSGKETNRVFIENGRFHGQAVVERIARSLGL